MAELRGAAAAASRGAQAGAGAASPSTKPGAPLPAARPATLPAWWPHAERSDVVRSHGLDWHVQRWPAPRPGAPTALLLHGTGASSHSFHRLAPLLAADFEVIAPDLPGHAFTRTPAAQGLGLPDVAHAVAALLTTLERRPALIVGHSAGAAIALQMTLAKLAAPRLVASINGAILPLQGPLGRLFLPLARLLVVNPLVPPAFAAWATLPGVAKRLLEGTGSRIDETSERCYAQLVRNTSHAAGALRLMASWNLHPLAQALPGLHTPLLLLAADNDRTLPPTHARRVLDQVWAAAPGEGDGARQRHARLLPLPGTGHLAHEEDAATVHRILVDEWRRTLQVRAG